MLPASSLAPVWLDGEAAGDALSPGPGTTLQGLRMLAILRTVAPIAQALTLVLVAHRYQVRVPVNAVTALIALEALVAAATWWRLRRAAPVSPRELFAQVHVDIVLFALLLYLTGGASNPFAPLFLLPMAIATSAMSSNRVWLVTLSTMAAYAALRYWHVPLHHPDGLTEVYALHEDGMVVNYLFTAALAAFFGTRMCAATRRHDRMLGDARDAQMRNESVVAIGALAAGYAHELSSPLATMAVVVSELKREHRDDPDLQHNLDVIEQQIGASKQIISKLASTAGQRRAETASGARLDQFIAAIVERAQALHPGASIGLKLDTASVAPQVIVEETLRQAITNLIDNAVQASPHYVVVRADWSQGELLVEVRDRGPGFSTEALGRLGKQAGTTKAEHGGLGVGLLLSAATLERLHGRLEFANDPQGGACARVRVPLSSIRINKQ
ncbi:histidine kinase [Leptothrix cholodnii SP-6]|uniref:histidine kinase n=1 Tax=Leptothrix cholodnii (strain ATCC 51168 / LMG 8142 / SP-6) TaxID=395495 RepID=B1Y7K0_LEPCP|nr:ATP-binding protein [Leptothrix cholodnii]ACB36148.1 histidine kinase [Leptothrix cholodnii SP-6]